MSEDLRSSEGNSQKMVLQDVVNYEPPHGNTIIWRYMGIDKFLDLLTGSRLFFANQRLMTDQNEATIPAKNIASMRRKLIEEGACGQELEELLSVYEYPIAALRGGTQINCWSISKHESYALWKIYLSSSMAGVAIRTTISRLRRAILYGNDTYHDTIYLGRVRYDDFIKEDPNRFNTLLTKSKFYEFESELRLMILEFPMSEGGESRPYKVSIGRNVSVNLELLIESLYVSPFTGSWFEDGFRKLVAIFNPQLEERIVKSKIRDV